MTSPDTTDSARPGMGARFGGAPRSQAGFRVAYLVNIYPSVSHTFIRREISELEARGLTIDRFSIRAASPDSLSDKCDLHEHALTTVLLSSRLWLLAAATVRQAMRGPVRLWRAIAIAVRESSGSLASLMRHCAYLMEACRLARHVRDLRIRHIHAHYGTNPATVAMLAGVLADVPFSFTMHGSSCFDVITSIGIERKVEQAAFVVTVSRYGRSQLMRFIDPSYWHKIHVIHCGLPDGVIYDHNARCSDDNKLLCVARLSPEKGLAVLIEAAELLLREGVAFNIAIVGDGPCRHQLEEMVRRRDLTDRVMFTGACDGPTVRRHMESACALVIPSFMEGLPVVAMESLAAGTPVIATAVGGIPEIVRPGETGWLVVAGDSTALASAMKQVLSCSASERGRLGASGQRLVRREFSGAASAETLHRLFIEPRPRAMPSRSTRRAADTNEAG